MGIYVIYTWDVCTKAVNFHPRHWTLEYCPTQTDNYGNEWELWYLKHVTIIISLNVSTTIYKLLKLKVPFLRVYLKPSHHVSSYCSIIIWADICSILFMGKLIWTDIQWLIVYLYWNHDPYQILNDMDKFFGSLF